MQTLGQACNPGWFRFPSYERFFTDIFLHWTVGKAPPARLAATSVQTKSSPLSPQRTVALASYLLPPLSSLPPLTTAPANSAPLGAAPRWAWPPPSRAHRSFTSRPAASASLGPGRTLPRWALRESCPRDGGRRLGGGPGGGATGCSAYPTTEAAGRTGRSGARRRPRQQRPPLMHKWAPRRSWGLSGAARGAFRPRPRHPG